MLYKAMERNAVQCQAVI